MKMRKMQKRRIISFIICCSIVMGLFTPVGKMDKVYANAAQLEQALQWAVAIANDNSHGYSQTSRWGPDYDCSSLVISALKNAGFDTGAATYTGNMKSNLTPRGFQWIPWSSIGNASNLKRGDILLNQVYHMAFYLGNNQVVEGHGRSQADKNYDSRDVSVAKTRAGDQDGQEIRVTNYYWYSKGWDGVLRCNAPTLNTPQLSLSAGTNSYEAGQNIVFNWTWGGIEADGYDLFVARYNEEKKDYDWADARRAFFGGNATTSGTISARVFASGGSYAVYAQACAPNDKRSGQSNFVYLTVASRKPKVEIWISRTKMGEKTGVMPIGKECYLCYRITDEGTQKNWDELYKNSYRVKETFTDPNGQTYSHTYTNDNNWISIQPAKAGKYKGTIEISGELNEKLECSFIVKKFYYGDIDANDDITPTDLAMAKRAVNDANALTADQRKRADVNADGAVTDEDVTLMAQFVVGAITEFPVESHVHSYSSKVTKNATCTSTGVRTYSCTCGESYTQTISKTSHTPVTDQAVVATCTQAGKTEGSHCSVCGTVIMEQKAVAVTGHLHTEVRNARNATTLSDGYTGDTYCKDCGIKIASGKVIEKIQNEGGEKDEINTDDPHEDKKTDENGSENVDEDDDEEDEEEDVLEVGDMLYDVSGKAEYEVVKISGETVFVSYNATLKKKQKVVTVPNQIKTEDGIDCKVIAVSERAFYNNKYVKKIVLGSNISRIGARAFTGCRKLTSLTIKSKGITSKSLKSKTFKGISSKTKIKVPAEKRDAYKKLFYKKGLSKRVKVCNM